MEKIRSSTIYVVPNADYYYYYYIQGVIYSTSSLHLLTPNFIAFIS